MAERSFAREVQDLKLGEGEEFRGEGILAITKALLQSGVSYVGGYQGAPISHLMDVLADAKDVLDDLGVHFENSASEAAAAATLAASVMYPIRGAVTFKAPVGINVASDAIANLASGGVNGGALIIIGEDYGEGSSIMQERSHPFAMKSQVWLLDPRPDLPTIVKAVEDGFELSEASHTPVMLEVRIRACHVHGRFIAKDNKKPSFTLRQALENPRRDTDRVVLPPASYLHEREKIEQRWPAAVKFIKERKLNEFFGPEAADVGIIVQGGMYNSVLRALQQLGLADVYGETSVPIYCLNVTYPLIDDEVAAFAADKKAILMVEEGQPEFIEQALNTILRRRDIQTRICGKDVLPMAGEYTPQVVTKGIKSFLELHGRDLLGNAPPPPDAAAVLADPKVKELARTVPPRPPSFCIGCPERPIFAAMKLVQEELGQHQIAGDIGCHLFASLPPFNIGGTTMGYGLGPASSSAFNVKADKKPISIMGDGGFWHNGLSSSIGNAVYNKHDGVIMVVDNFYSAATGGQDIMSSRALNPARSTNNTIVDAVKGVGVKWVRHIDRTYDVGKMRETLRQALTSKESGPKVIVASSECMLNKQRRVKPLFQKSVRDGRRMVRERFGVDEDVCTGDHACIRLSGCPSLSVKHTDDPLKDDPVAAIDNNCVGCGNCGEVAEAAVLCPSFYRADIIHNPSWFDRFVSALRRSVIGYPAAPARGAPRRLRGLTRNRGVMNDLSRMPTRYATERPICVAVLAMGGQGGGVLADWIVELAESRGWHAQSTSIPGVAQRTGATLYYVEMLPPKGGKAPILSLMPAPGEVDVVLAAELMEAGRSILRGLVTPDRSTLIASTHRLYSVAEKEKPGDAIADPNVVMEAADVAAKRVIAFDMEVLANRNNSVISACLFGALAASGTLPFERDSFEAIIKSGGRGVEFEPECVRRRLHPGIEIAGGGPARSDRQTGKTLCAAAGLRRAPRARQARRPHPRFSARPARDSVRRRQARHRFPGSGLRGRVSRSGDEILRPRPRAWRGGERLRAHHRRRQIHRRGHGL